MMTWSVDRGTLTANHLRGLQAALSRRPIGNHLAARAYLRLHEGWRRSRCSCALILALHTGQREGDLLRLPLVGLQG